MTRETKVGLLAGMALILLIGILVSDHLSVGQREPANQMGGYHAGQSTLVTPPQARHLVGGPRQLDNSPSEQARGANGSNPSRTGPTIQAPDEITIGGPPARRRRNEAGTPDGSRQRGDGTQVARERGDNVVPARTPQRRLRWHVVAPGENLIRISKRYYGAGKHWRVIQEANPDTIGPNGRIRQGTRIVIPDLEREQAPAASQPARSGVGQTVTGGKTITVEPGQTLSSLALTYLGSSGLVSQLFEANRDVLNSPDVLKPGVVLRLPAPQQIVRPIARTRPPASDDANTYTVKSGETLSSISAKVLGESSRWQRLYNANRSQLKSPHSLAPGMKLTIPKDGV